MLSKQRSDIEIIQWARSVMEEHNLISDGWSFKISNRFKNTLGQCSYRRKLIQLARDHVKQDTYESILDTLKHEIAHALAGSFAGHGKQWQKIAMELGARPTSHKPREFDPDIMEENVYIMTIHDHNGDELFVSSLNKKTYDEYMSGKRNIKLTYVPGHKPQTLGRLQPKCVKVSEVPVEHFC